MLNYFITALKKYFVFSGRARRSEYWYFVLVALILQYGLMGLGFALEIPALLLASTGVSLVLLIPNISVGVRRMHDVGKSGWFLLIPIYNLILACTDSEPGTNRFGPNPKNEGLETSDHLIA